MRVTREGDLLLDSFKWSNTPAKVPGSFEKFPAGAYVCRIVNLNFNTKENGDIQAVFDIDVAEGDHVGHFTKRAKNSGGTWPYASQFKRYAFRADEGDYSKNFKGFVQFLTQQNPNFKPPEDRLRRQDFIGLLCGFTYGEEEYEATDGSIKTTCKLQFPQSVKDVREGKVKTPEVRKLDDSKRKYKPNNSAYDDVFANAEDVDDDDIPF